MNSNAEGKPEPADPENTVRMLELELMRQRAARQHAGTPYRGLRAAGFVFFIVVVLGALLAFYYLFYSGGLDALRARNASPSATPRSSSTP